MRTALVFALFVSALPLAPRAEDLTPRLQELEEGTDRAPAQTRQWEPEHTLAPAPTRDEGGWGVLWLAGVAGVGLALGVAGRDGLARWRERTRRERLLAKYADDGIVAYLVSRMLWTGETTEQLVDSLGTPSDVDEKVVANRRRRIWKYGRLRGDRYRLRILLEDDVVVGWEPRHFRLGYGPADLVARLPRLPALKLRLALPRSLAGRLGQRWRG
jgi:hypothetical protein